MKSQGTKETQGINGDAALLQRKQDAALAAAAALGGEMPPCAYERHRGLELDWVNAGGRVICGYCHPPVRGIEVERVA